MATDLKQSLLGCHPECRRNTTAGIVCGGGGGGIYWMQMDSEGGGEGWLKERRSLL